MRINKKNSPLKEINDDDKYKTVNYSIDAAKKHLKKRRSLILGSFKDSP